MRPRFARPAKLRGNGPLGRKCARMCESCGDWELVRLGMSAAVATVTHPTRSRRSIIQAASWTTGWIVSCDTVSG